MSATVEKINSTKVLTNQEGSHVRRNPKITLVPDPWFLIKCLRASCLRCVPLVRVHAGHARAKGTRLQS